MATMVRTTPEFNDSILPNSRTMKALVFVKEGVVELREKAIPTVGPNDALLRVTMTTICGTDVHILKGEYPVESGLTIGHEPVGVIVGLGSAVTGFQLGQRVIAGAITPCGQCHSCLDGVRSQCGGKVMGGWKFGNTIDGCQAEFVLVPNAVANLAPIPVGLTDEQVLMCPDIMSTGFGGAESGNIRIGDVVAVFAQGPIGLCATAGAKMRGASTIVAVDMLDGRLDVSRTLGADIAINAHEEDPVEAILKLTSGRGTQCGLIIDFVGVLKELNKALAFDSDEVESVIEDLDVLLQQFLALMDSAGRDYLAQMDGAGANDEVIDRLVNETFFDKERRKEFAEFFREVEGLYEILSPSSELRDYITPYNRLADLYAILRNAYGHRGAFGADLAHKTERLIREQTTALGEYAQGKAVEFDAASLEALRAKGRDDNGKVINLVRKLRDESTKGGDEQLLLISLSERADRVLEQLEDRQVSTQQALDEIARLLAERAEAERVRDEHGLDAATFEIYWVLRDALPSDAVTLAKEMRDAQLRYPNAASNSGEYRQLKAELYKLLLRFGIDGARMLAIAEDVLRSVRS